jgi:acetyl-CoA acetyltransferase
MTTRARGSKLLPGTAVLAWAHDTGDLARTNVSGGATAMGDPIGASAAPS